MILLLRLGDPRGFVPSLGAVFVNRPNVSVHPSVPLVVAVEHSELMQSSVTVDVCGVRVGTLVEEEATELS